MTNLKDPRVLFAAERTLLAWNRTSLTFIAFGFVVERTSLFLNALYPARVVHGSAAPTFWLGLAFIVLGVFAAVFSSRQYMIVLRTLNSAEIPLHYSPRWGLFVNAVVAVLGAVLIAVLYEGRT